MAEGNPISLYSSNTTLRKYWSWHHRFDVALGSSRHSHFRGRVTIHISIVVWEHTLENNHSNQKRREDNPKYRFCWVLAVFHLSWLPKLFQFAIFWPAPWLLFVSCFGFAFYNILKEINCQLHLLKVKHPETRQKLRNFIFIQFTILLVYSR